MFCFVRYICSYILLWTVKIGLWVIFLFVSKKLNFVSFRLNVLKLWFQRQSRLQLLLKTVESGLPSIYNLCIFLTLMSQQFKWFFYDLVLELTLWRLMSLIFLWLKRNTRTVAVQRMLRLVKRVRFKTKYCFFALPKNQFNETKFKHFGVNWI